MNKYKLAIVFIINISFFSCSKNEVVCKKTTSGLKTKVTITEEQYIVCSMNACVTNELGSTTKEDYINSLEASGFSCK